MNTRNRLFRSPSLVAGLLAALILSGCTSNASTSTKKHAHTPTVWKYSSHASVVGGRYVDRFELDNGALVIDPIALNYRTVRTLSAVTIQAWATSQISGFEPLSLGLGRVTIRDRFRGFPRIRHLVAWIALAYVSGNSRFCAFEGSHFHSQSIKGLFSPGTSAVVIGDALGSPALVFQSKGFVCGRITARNVSTASEVLSVPWRYKHGQVSVTLPRCSFEYSEVTGSTPTFSSFRYEVLQREGAASAPSGHSTCRKIRTVVLHDPYAAGVTNTTHHEAVGPEMQVTSRVVLTSETTTTPDWRQRAPISILKNLRRESPLPIGAPGSTLYEKLGRLIDIPLSARQQLVAGELRLLKATQRYWIFVEVNAPIFVGCPSGTKINCDQNIRGTWVALVNPKTGRVLFTISL